MNFINKNILQKIMYQSTELTFVNSIMNNLALITTSFTPRYDQSPLYFGINLSNLNFVEMKKIIEFEEPRISIQEIKYEKNEIVIRFYPLRQFSNLYNSDQLLEYKTGVNK